MNTPETDKAERMAYSQEYMVPTEFARKLERERDELQSQNKKLIEEVNDLIKQRPLLVEDFKKERDEAREEWGKSSMDAAQLLSEKTKIMAERDQLKEALLIMENLLKPGIELFPEIGEILKQGAK